MKISTLSDSEISLWIAEKLEPKPSDHLCSGPKYNPCAYQDPYECPACIFRGLKKPDFHFHIWKDQRWQPRDMVNDAQMQEFLLDKCFERWPYFSIGNTGSAWEFEGSGRTPRENIYCTLPLMPRRRALCIFFMKWNGYTEQGNE